MNLSPIHAEARRRFGTDPFVIDDLMEVIRPHVNPMEMARIADRNRVTDAPDRCKAARRDAVSVGLRRKALNVANNYVRAGRAERVGGGVFRFLASQEGTK